MKKLDEMDKKIRLQSQSLSFKIALLLLSFWTIYECVVAFMEKHAPNSISMYILLAVVVFESIYEQILKHRMVQDDEEYKEPNKAFLTIIAIVVVVAVLLSVGAMFMFR